VSRPACCQQPATRPGTAAAKAGQSAVWRRTRGKPHGSAGSGVCSGPRISHFLTDDPSCSRHPRSELHVPVAEPVGPGNNGRRPVSCCCCCWACCNPCTALLPQGLQRPCSLPAGSPMLPCMALPTCRSMFPGSMHSFDLVAANPGPALLQCRVAAHVAAGGHCCLRLGWVACSRVPVLEQAC